MTESEKKCIEQALRFLVLRDHNRNELTVKLKKKGYDSQTIARAIDFLEAEDSLNEERYVQSFIRSNNRRHPEGKFVMLQRLASKGADRETAARVVEDTYSIEYVSELVSEAKTKLQKQGKTENISYYLHRLGFTESDIQPEK